MSKRITLIEISDEKPMLEWAAKLMGERHEEAVESIRREQVEEEFVSFVEIEGKKYLAFYMEGEMLPADMSMPVNLEHKAVMASIVKNRINTTPLYEVSLKK